MRILLVEDHEMVRAGLKSILQGERDIEAIYEAGDGRTAVRLARDNSPDIVIMDINLPDLNGIEATRQIINDGFCSKVIALSVHSDRQFVDGALEAGARAYLLKNGAANDLSLAIKSVLR